MKNILIINYNNSQGLPGGGIEAYNQKLIKILTDKSYKIFEIDFYPQLNINIKNFKNYEYIDHKINFSKKSGSVFKLPFLILKFAINVFKFNSFINKIIKNKKINIVIDNTKGIPYIKNKKVSYIWMIHGDPIKIYNEKKLLFNRFKNWISLESNRFKFNKIIVFSKKDKELLLNKDKKLNANNIYFCPLANKNLSEINNLNVELKISNAENIVYLGRLYQKEKNIDFIRKLGEKLININIYVYGYGPDKNLIINKAGIKYQGPFKKEEVDEILKKAKLLILPSFTEGFPYVIVEALSNGVPCLVANTFSDANYLVDETRGGVYW